MINTIDFADILFLDIETISAAPRFSDLTEHEQLLWNQKSQWMQQKDGISAEEAYSKAAIYAEFGKVVAIAYGKIMAHEAEDRILVRSIASLNERDLLCAFAELLCSNGKKTRILCAHNGKEFDFPFLARRMIIHQIQLPPQLQLAGKKPWEIPHLDTLEFWKFGDYKHYSSLDLLAHCLQIPSPKLQMSGADVGKHCYEPNGLERVESYCRADVIALIRIACRMHGINQVMDFPVDE